MSLGRRVAELRRWDAPGLTLGDVGEAELLRRLMVIASEHAALGMLLAAGDDAALWQPPPGRQLAVSQDASVEGQDFERSWTHPGEVGRKAAIAALSDLAGMGAEPAWCVATLCARAETCVEDVMEIQRGLCTATSESGCTLAGGDVSGIEGPLVIDVCAGGTVVPGRLLRRDRGLPGDALVVTGHLGGAAAGLEILKGAPARQADHAGAAGWLGRQLHPSARLAEGMALVERGCDCGGDLSDGLLVEARRLAAASGCGAELWLEGLPLAPELQEAFPERWPELALGGGEDFELLAAVRPEELDRVLGTWPPQLAPLTLVGRLLPAPGLRLLAARAGTEVTPPPVLSRHFTIRHA